MSQVRFPVSLSVDDRNFLDLIRELDRLQLPYWVTCGSLLGLFRDNKLIEWDGDIDIAIFAGKGQISELYSRMTSIGFSGGWSFRRRPGKPSVKLARPGGRRIDLMEFVEVEVDGVAFFTREWYKEDTSPKTLAKLQMKLVNLLYQIRMVLVLGRDPSSPKPIPTRRLKFASAVIGKLERAAVTAFRIHDETQGYFVRVKDVLPLGAALTTCGLRVSFPERPAAVLEQMYGTDWRIPQKSTHWTQWLTESPAASTRSVNYRLPEEVQGPSPQ